MLQTIHHNTFRIGINPKLLEKARNFFNASLTDILNELLQNARRAGASRVAISYDPASMSLTVSDDGSGIFRHGVTIDLGGSGWDGAMQASEDPAGCGLYHFSKFLTDIELLKSKTIPSNTRSCYWIENLKDGKVYFLSYQGS
jgi:hypothetical protein